MLDDRSYCLALEPSAGLAGRALRVCARTIKEDCRGAIWSSPSVEVFVLRVSWAFEIGERP